MVVEEFELAQVDIGVETGDFAYLLVVEDNLLDLPLPCSLRVNYDACCGGLRLCLLLCLTLFHLIVLLLCLQIVSDHLWVHLDSTLVDAG